MFATIFSVVAVVGLITTTIMIAKAVFDLFRSKTSDDNKSFIVNMQGFTIGKSAMDVVAYGLMFALAFYIAAPVAMAAWAAAWAVTTIGRITIGIYGKRAGIEVSEEARINAALAKGREYAEMSERMAGRFANA